MSSLFRLRRPAMGKEQELLQAVRQQNSAVVFKIVQKNAKSKSFLSSGKQKRINFNYQDCEGMSACHHAAVVGNNQMLTTLLENAANVDLQDNRGLRPIHYASAHGRTESVHLLLRCGSSTNMGAFDGCTPLHLACQNGHVDVVKLLIYNHGDVNIRSHEGRTPFDLACEYGRFSVVDLLLSSNLVQHQLHSRPVDPAVPEHFTCLHLAAQNGHTDVLRLLIKQPGVDINRRMPRGTCLHEAAAGGHFLAARMLLENGIDPHKTNSYGQISSEVVPPGAPNAKELKQLLQEACFAVRAEAIRDYCDLRNQNSIAFRVGESVTVLEQCPDGMWKGYVTQEGMARTGYFPASAIRLQNRSDPGMDCTFGPDERFPPPPSPAAGCAPSGPGDTPPPLPPPPHYPQVADSVPAAPPHLLTCAAGGSNRNSAASVDSGRSSAHTAGSDCGRSGHGCFPLSGQAAAQGSAAPVVSGARSSMQSMESGLCRQSYVSSSSSSSLGSLDHLEGGGSGGVDADSAYSSTGTSSARSLSLLPGCAALSPCSLRSWLQESGLGQCAEALLTAGYDLGTATRMTPEDMNAAGITNPHVRKRLKAELSRACISDGLPDFIPESVMQWVKCLNLEEYCDILLRQGYCSLDKVMEITWEDLEEIGIKRLGHQKKVILAIERLRRLKKGSESAMVQQTPVASRPSRFHHHQLQATLHTPPSPSPDPVSPPPEPSPLPPASPRTAIVPPTLSKPAPPRLPASPAPQPAGPHTPPPTPQAGKPVAKIPPGRVSNHGSLERRKQPPPPPPKRITSMKSSPCRRPSSPRRHNYENLKGAGGESGALAAIISQAERRGMRRSSAPSDRRVPPNLLPRRSPEMSDDSSAAAQIEECLKSRSSSTLSVESNSLPFANENVGTIKQRSNSNSKPSLSSLDFYASLDLNVGSYTAENGTIRRKVSPPVIPDSPRKCPPPVPRRRDSIGGEEESARPPAQANDQEQLDDICDMLEDLSDMLEREIAEDEQLRLV